MGFEFSEKKGGDPTVVQLVYSYFANVVRDNQDAFESFVSKNLLEVEWVSKSQIGNLRLLSSADAVRWLLKPTEELYWVFIGRLLRPGVDAPTLEDSQRLGE